MLCWNENLKFITTYLTNPCCCIGCSQQCYPRPQTIGLTVWHLLDILQGPHYHARCSRVSWHHDYPISITDRDQGAHLDWKFSPNITNITQTLKQSTYLAASENMCGAAVWVVKWQTLFLIYFVSPIFLNFSAIKRIFQNIQHPWWILNEKEITERAVNRNWRRFQSGTKHL